VSALTEGIQEEMMAAMLNFYKGAAAACADICTARMSMMYSQLAGQNLNLNALRAGDDTAAMFRGLGSMTAGANGIGPGDSRHALLVRSVRQRLQQQGETPEIFFRQRAAMGRGLISREDFISGLSSLSLGASAAELADLFRSIVGGTDRDALLEEIVTGLDAAAGNNSTGQFQLGGATPAEAEQVLGRVRSAVSRSGRPLDEVFRGFCRSNTGAPGIMSRTDLKRVLSTFEPGLNADVVARLWRALVPDGASGLDFQTFCAWFSPGGRSLTAAYPNGFSGAYPSESAMLSNLLEMSVNSPLSQSLPGGINLFPSSPNGQSNLASTLPAARDNATISALVGGMSPGGAMAQTLPPARSAWSDVNNMQGQARPPVTRDELPVLACLYRFGWALKSKSSTVDRAFVLHDTGRDRSVDVNGFGNACEQSGIPLSKSEIRTLFMRLARTMPQGEKVLFDELDAAIKNAESLLRDDVSWAQNFIYQIDQIARKTPGSSLEKDFRARGGAVVYVGDVQSVLQRHSTISSEQWAVLMPLLDKKSNGDDALVPWEAVLTWAGVRLEGATIPLPGAPSPPLPAAPGSVGIQDCLPQHHHLQWDSRHCHRQHLG